MNDQRSRSVSFGAVLVLILSGCGSDGGSIVDPPGNPAPEISAIAPERGKAGTQVTITGTNFAATPAENTVTFNGVAATVMSASATSLVAVVPNGAGNGPVAVAVDGQTAGGPDFTVLPDNTRFVQSNGSDGDNDCLEATEPCATITRAVNVADAGDPIDIGPGTYTEADGIAIDKSLTLSGAGVAGTIVQAHALHGQATSRVFTISSPSSDAHAEVGIAHMTIRHGVAPGSSNPDGSGGGILVIGSTLNLSDVDVALNRAERSGGGVYMFSASGTFANVTFRENEAAALVGGGLRNWNGSSPVLTDVSFILNRAGTRGGGMHNENGSSPTLTGVTFDHNHASVSGGGLYNSDDSHPALSDVTIVSNTADSNGGGMVNVAGGSAVLSDVTFEANSAGNDGGALWNDTDETRLSNVTFTGNQSGNQGGGMYNTNGSPVLDGVQFESNSATFGGGVFNDGGSGPAFVNVTFLENEAVEWGGGMRNLASSPTLANVTFRQNHANFGGGMNNTGSAPSLTNVRFIENSARTDAGAIENFTSSPRLVNVTLDRNHAVLSGGAMRNVDGSPELINVTFSGNSAGRSGGGMYSVGNSHPSLRNTIVRGNTAGDAGGGNEIHSGAGSTAELYYSLYGNDAGDIAGTITPDANSLTDDPLFVDAADGDLRLMSESPAINSGDPGTNLDIFLIGAGVRLDLGDNPRVVNGRIDLGAFEHQGS